MCGRFAQTQSGAAVAEALQLTEVPEISPRYNIAPTQQVSVITQSRRTAQREHHWQQWGLIPAWARDARIGQRLINARAETAAQKPAFRDALQRRRCLIVADGFYEWQRSPQGGRKQPFLIQLQARSLFAFAGLWERWQDPQTQTWIDSCTLLTTQSRGRLAAIHPRMPVVVPCEQGQRWLDPEAKGAVRLEEMGDWMPFEQLRIIPIRGTVNSPSHDSAAVQQPLEVVEDPMAYETSGNP